MTASSDISNAATIFTQESSFRFHESGRSEFYRGRYHIALTLFELAGVGFMDLRDRVSLGVNKQWYTETLEQLGIAKIPPWESLR